MGGGAWSGGFRASRKKNNTYNENMRTSYFTDGSMRNMMFDDEDNQTGINAGADIVFGKKRRGSIFGQDLGNMFGN